MPVVTTAEYMVINFAVWRPRSSGRGGNAAPPLGVSRLPVRIVPDKLGIREDSVQVPGIPGPGAGQRPPDRHESHRRTGLAERGVLGAVAAGDPPPAGRVHRVLR